jgi:hypothetical protein
MLGHKKGLTKQHNLSILKLCCFAIKLKREIFLVESSQKKYLLKNANGEKVSDVT